MTMVTPTTVSSAAAVIASHPGAGDQTEHVVEGEMADEDDGDDRAEHAHRRHEVHLGARDHRARGKQRRERDERDRREILEQQHGEPEPAVAGRQLAVLLQHL